MRTLDFKGKQHIYAHHLTVPYRPLEPDATRSCNPTDTNDNLIIHGDNLHALKALLPRYANRIKCIYIDPPYNTGNKDWKYDDNINSPMMQQWLTENAPVDNEDLERHDKWLCMMWPRLHLLKELLADDGIIFVSISVSVNSHEWALYFANFLMPRTKGSRQTRVLRLMRYLVFFEKGEANYSAFVPDLPVCIAVGDTLEETRKEISEAIKFHIECL